MTRQASIGDWIRLAYEGDERCPPPEAYLPEELAALDRSARERLEQHAAECAACASESELAQSFAMPESLDAGERGDVEQIARRLRQNPPHGKARGWLGRLPGWGWLSQTPALQLAAVAVILIGVGVGLRSASTPPPLTGEPGDSVMRSAALDVLAPVGEVEAIPHELSWSAVDGAARYVVVVRGVDEAELWRAESTATSIPIGDSLAVALRPAVAYVWSVEAFDPSGGRIAWSPATRFHIRPSIVE